MYKKQVKTLISRFGHVESYLDLCGVQNLAFALRGQELFIDYYENPRLAHHLLTVCTQTLIAVADRLRQYTSHISTGVSSILGKTAPQAYLTSNCTVVSTEQIPIFAAAIKSAKSAQTGAKGYAGFYADSTLQSTWQA